MPSYQAGCKTDSNSSGSCTGRNSISIMSIWMLATHCADNTGSIVGGVLLQFLGYHDSAMVLVVLCSVSVVSCAMLRIALPSSGVSEPDIEKTALLSEEGKK